MTGRNISIDVGKGIAICFVVISHVLQKSIYGNDIVFEYSALENFLVAVQMPLFMFLSGIVARNVGPKEIGTDIVKRFRTIIVPFLVIGLFSSVATISANWNPFSFISDEWKSGYWYFLVLFYCYVINYCLCFLSFRKPIVRQGVKLILALIIWKGLGFLVNLLPDNIVTIFSLKPYMTWIIPYFFVGNAVKELNLTRRLAADGWMFIASFAIALAGSGLHELHTLALVVFMFGIAERMSLTKAGSVFSYLGRNSVYIYLFHFFVFRHMNLLFMSQWMCQHSGIVTDLLISIPLAAVAILFSLFIMKLLQYDKRIHSLIFGR